MRRCDRRAVLAVCAFIAVVLVPGPAATCEGDPPPPFCGKTLVLALGNPDVLVSGTADTVDIEAAVFFNMVDFPPGTGICPAGPYAVDITVDLTCTPGPDASGSVTAQAVVFGWNDITVPVSVPSGVSRRCEVEGTVTIALADGMVLTDDARTVACIGDPAPLQPALPRLDIELLTGATVSRVHGGDQSEPVYRVTNNDDTEAFNGVLRASSTNEAKRPGMSGPTPPPGTGVYAVADPGLGDNFTVGFAGDLDPAQCLLLPADPGNPAPALAFEPLVIAPGGFVDVPLFVRPWPMCAGGSCSAVTLDALGTFTDGTGAVACTGMVSAVDPTVPPTFSWPDAGSTALLDPGSDPFIPVLPLEGVAAPSLPPLQVEIQIVQMELTAAGLPAGPPNHLASPIEPVRGRILSQWAAPFQVDSFFDIAYRIDFVPLPGSPYLLDPPQVVMTGAPTGGEQISPYASARMTARTSPSGDPAVHLDSTVQLHAEGVDQLGNRIPLLLQNVQLVTAPNGVGLVGSTTAIAPTEAVEGGVPIFNAIEVWLDFSGEAFVSPSPPLLFRDRFESGDTTQWSTIVP